MHVTVKFVVYCSECLTTITWRRGTEPIFTTIAKSFHDPGKVKLFDDRFNAFGKLFLQLNCL